LDTRGVSGAAEPRRPTFQAFGAFAARVCAALRREASERDLERQFADARGVVAVEPVGEDAVFGAVGIGEGFEAGVEAGDRAAVFGGRRPLVGDVAGTGDGGVCGSLVGDGEPMFPAVAHIVGIGDAGLARLEQFAELDLAGVDDGGCAPSVAGMGWP
jgi:hypothetical protein